MSDFHCLLTAENFKGPEECQCAFECSCGIPPVNGGTVFDLCISRWSMDLEHTPVTADDIEAIRFAVDEGGVNGFEQKYSGTIDFSTIDVEGCIRFRLTQLSHVCPGRKLRLRIVFVPAEGGEEAKKISCFILQAGK